MQDFNHFVHKDGEKTLVADGKVLVSLHSGLSET